MISCLTVTREARFASLERAVADFVRQTWAERELVIVHDGDASLRCRSSGRWPPRTRARRLPFVANPQDKRSASCAMPRSRPRAGRDRLSMGRRRPLPSAPAGIAVRGDARREQRVLLSDRPAAPVRRGPDACTGTTGTSRSIRSTWSRARCSGAKPRSGRYPPLARGEDTPLILDLLRRGRRITRLREHGYLYVYVFDGKNAWGYDHHATISAWKRFRGARLLALEPTLRARLAEYEPPLGHVRDALRGWPAGLRCSDGEM